LKLTLKDVNDNSPVFDTVKVDPLEENSQIGDLVTTFKATDQDYSNEFGTSSIR